MEHLDVVIVGAGLSGIAAAHHLQVRCGWAEYAIFEARDAIGGTWDLFRYPGIRSDSDMFTLGYSFRPWQGDKSIADGDSILSYIRDTAADEGIDRCIRFGRRVVAANWCTDDARWELTVRSSDTGSDQRLTCSFVLCCTGYYRYDHGHMPHFEGMDRFNGTIVHPQAWPADLDYADKHIVVIGSGATAVTLIPSLAEQAAHVTMLQRSPTYIASLPARNEIANTLRRWLPTAVSGPLNRWMNALGTQFFYELSRRRPAMVKKVLRRQLELQLPPGYDIDRHFTPSYNPWDQRVCLVPDGDLFKAIGAGTASVVTDHIETFTDKGLRLRSGEELEADIIITATGLDLLFLGGMELKVDGELVDPSQLLSYKGAILEGVPNMAAVFGYTNASWTLKCDLTCDFVCRLLHHMRSAGWRQFTAVNHDPDMERLPFVDLASGYIQRSIDDLPKQGSHFPWQVHQSYLRDWYALKRSPIEDGSIVFSNAGSLPAPRRTAVSSDPTALPG